MRLPIVLSVAILAAGCLAAPDPDADAAFEPLHLEDEYWVETSTGPDPSTTTIDFPVNASGRRLRAEVSITETYGGIQVTGSTAQVVIRVIDAEGVTLGEASRAPLGSQNLHVEGEPSQGDARLIIEVRGGSDGSANGDRVRWTIDLS